ncbi:lytic transglycosylase domain-containing protein [Ruegeria sp.]|uniref:lytic transglycosylase domain-containing protein n=1 Tax=Ruegeria sp. TaxID=1879320 RepID=UPI002327E3BE|nr:lytic transglycosylase domain-containing protein [Ruegeria sp.]MDA7964365.1 lytic transglycosylase domain-containing protein [Ruegeria sp.]
MPNLRLLLVLLVLPLPAAAITADICDQAARRAAETEGVPLKVLRAITRVETGRVRDGRLAPWPWAVNVEGQGYWFASEAEAKAHIFNIFHAGTRSFDVGCFQINYRWHGKAFRSIDAMFDPDENAGYAARFLKQLYAELGSWPAAAGAYHSRTPNLAKAYSGRFQTVLAQLGDAPLPQTAQASRDPFTAAATPLVPLWQAESQQGALGSLMPATDGATAFIAFN